MSIWNVVSRVLLQCPNTAVHEYVVSLFSTVPTTTVTRRRAPRKSEDPKCCWQHLRKMTTHQLNMCTRDEVSSQKKKGGPKERATAHLTCPAQKYCTDKHCIIAHAKGRLRCSAHCPASLQRGTHRSLPTRCLLSSTLPNTSHVPSARQQLNTSIVASPTSQIWITTCRRGRFFVFHILSRPVNSNPAQAKK